MMTRTQLLLGKLAEESSEIAQIALKAQQFGLDDVWEKVAPLTVRDRLHGEVNDLLGILGMLNDEGDLRFVADPIAALEKVEKVNRFAALSVKLGMVEANDESPLLHADDRTPGPGWHCPTPGCGHFIAPDAYFPASFMPCPKCWTAPLAEFTYIPF